MAGPCASHVRGQPQVWPEFYEVIQADEAANIGFGAFSQDELVYLKPLSPIPQVPSSFGTAPEDVIRQAHDAGLDSLSAVTQVVRQRHGSRPPIASGTSVGLGLHGVHRTGMLRSGPPHLTWKRKSLIPQCRSRPFYYGDGLGGRGGNWVDGTARRGTAAGHRDENPHLAKVRVAGSNPVFRSTVAGQGAVFQHPNAGFGVLVAPGSHWLFGIWRCESGGESVLTRFTPSATKVLKLEGLFGFWRGSVRSHRATIEPNTRQFGLLA